MNDEFLIQVLIEIESHKVSSMLTYATLTGALVLPIFNALFLQANLWCYLAILFLNSFTPIVVNLRFDESINTIRSFLI